VAIALITLSGAAHDLRFEQKAARGGSYWGSAPAPDLEHAE
jgi:hypothetical protein